MPEKVFYHSIVWAVSFGTHALLNVFSYVCWMAGNVDVYKRQGEYLSAE